VILPPFSHTKIFFIDFKTYWPILKGRKKCQMIESDLKSKIGVAECIEDIKVGKIYTYGTFHNLEIPTVFNFDLGPVEFSIRSVSLFRGNRGVPGHTYFCYGFQGKISTGLVVNLGRVIWEGHLSHAPEAFKRYEHCFSSTEEYERWSRQLNDYVNSRLYEV
jgi:hypothetical protein